MKNNKKLVLGSVVALALSVGVVAPSLTKAAPTPAPVGNTQKSDFEAKRDAEYKRLVALKLKKPMSAEIDAAVSKVMAAKNDSELKAAVSYAEARINGVPLTPEEQAKIQKEKDLEAAKENAIAELKQNGITSKLLLDQIRSAKTIQAVDSLKATLIQSHKDSNKDVLEKDETGKTKQEKTYEELLRKVMKQPVEKQDELMKLLRDVKNAKTSMEFNNAVKAFEDALAGKKDPEEKPGKKDPEEKPEETKDGYETRAEAAAAAEKALEKDPVNKSYKVKQGSNGRFYYELSPVEEGLEIGYETREEAEAAAKEALENDPINNDYEINQGADGRYYFRTFYNAEKEDPAKPGKEDPAKPGKEDPVKPGKEDPVKPGKKDPVKPGKKDPVKPGKKDPVKPGKKDPVKQGTKKPAKAVVKKVNNVNTGVAGLTGVVATLAASAVALFKSKRK